MRLSVTIQKPIAMFKNETHEYMRSQMDTAPMSANKKIP